MRDARVKKDDPCTGVCRFDGRTGWCLGCGRTVPEIRAWRKSTPFRRTALARELPRRVLQVREATPENTK
ncbi:DUF1289 domain-containing protein [Methylobacterium sp. Leaf117]|uniref:DUF1289 domain-containing protein n=1 Tax=Methylobacterium sp. Leaf117 TaxID=1736260 RepID=UPI001FCE1A9B|nr:DUF1289 domain-containing protein [Methylobacterium sp. Leaf117]